MSRVKGLKSAEGAAFILLGLAASFITVFLYWYEPSFLVSIGLKANDAMFIARGEARPTGNVVIVAVDERSVNELGRWPWPREKTAALISSLGKARVVALDIVFSESESPKADKALSESIKKASNVVGGYFFRDDSTEEPGPAALEQIGKSRIGVVSLEGATDEQLPVPVFPGVEANTGIIGEGAIGFGAFNIIPQSDGIYRQEHLLYGFDGELYPALPLEAVSRFLEADIIVNGAEYGVDSIDVGGLVIPVNEEGAFPLNYYGKGGAFTVYSASDVINGSVPDNAFNDRLVFVGVTEKAIYDIRPTPVDSLFPGVEMHATAAANILEGRFLIHDNRVAAYDLFMTVFMAALLSFALMRLRRTLLSLLVFFALLAFIVLADFYLLSAYNIVASVLYPCLSLTLAYLSGEAYRNLVVEKRSRYLRKAFSTYVSSQLVSEILKDPDKLKLGGEKRTVTVLFSDIRGFTTLSERMPPEELVKLLNEYLSPMTSIVLNEEGMLDKYIGDAIMAVFNAPIEIPDHPRRACASAIRMISKLEELNAKWGALGYPRIDIGIGINTGEAVVGNMGAELRFDYTAIGDTVNLASRLEGMNKLYGTSVLASEFTHAFVKNEFLFRELDLVRVKGKEKPIVMHELMGAKGDQPKEALRDRFLNAMALYRARRFEEAALAFKSIHDETSDGPSMLYLKRCEEYKASPPSADWDGVFVAKTK